MRKAIRLIAALLVLALAIPGTALAAESDDIISCSWVEISSDPDFYVDELDGVRAYPGNQCNDLVIRYYEEVLGIDMFVGVSSPALLENMLLPAFREYDGDIGDIPDELSGFVKVDTPQKGDVVYWSATKRGKSYAHSALVKSYSDGVITLIEQNWNSNNKAAYERKVKFPSSYYSVYRPADTTSSEAEPEPSAEPMPTVRMSTHSVTVDGHAVDILGYNIDGHNYFMLRDIAAMLSGTMSSFSVGYDAETKTITLTRGENYDASSGGVNRDPAETVSRSTSKVYVDGELVEFTAYRINGNNYFMLREIAAAIDFGVSFDETTRTVQIFSDEHYTAE